MTPPGALLEPSWRPLGPADVVLGGSWVALTRPEGVPGGSWLALAWSLGPGPVAALPKHPRPAPCFMYR